MLQLSEEQNLICQSNSNEIKVNAFAGTGKTTTLIHYSQQHLDKKILYICYNKSIQLEAESKFPKNVVKKTSHSLAYQYIGFKYKEKLVSFINNSAVKEYLKLEGSKNPEIAVKVLVNTVSNFCSSADYDFNSSHLPRELLCMSDIIKREDSLERIEMIEEAILKRARILWQLMCDINQKAIGMTHDGYLKLFQLKEIQLPYDIIMLDEAQDANPATLAILKSQTNAQIILVGDTHQSIYSFRGAINAMEEFKQAEQFYLTNSFRFGQEVANYANSILGMMGETKEMKGLGQTQIQSKTPNNKSATKNTTILFRNNNSVFTYAFDFLKDQKIYLEGGINNYNLDGLYDVYYLFAGKKDKIKDPLISSFNNIDSLYISAEINGNPQLLNQVNLIKKYGHSFLNKLSELRSRVVKTEQEADVVLTNVHKAKGKEYNQIELSEDFFSSAIDPKSYIKWLHAQKNQHLTTSVEHQELLSSINNLQKHNVIHHIPDDIREESNIAYVALTRAKNKIILPFNYNNYLHISHKLFSTGFHQQTTDLMNKFNFIVTDEAKAKIGKLRLDKIMAEKPLKDNSATSVKKRKI